MKNGIIIIVLLISGFAFSQTTINLENQCNCEVIKGTDVTAPGVTFYPADLGDIYINTDTGILYFWDGDSWELTSGNIVTNKEFEVDTENKQLVITDSDGGQVHVSFDEIADAIDKDEQDLANVLGEGADANGIVITNLGIPTANQDAATKSYVDGAITANTADGSETLIKNGTTTTVSGTGVLGGEYQIEVADAAITNAKLADGSVTVSKLTADVVDAGKVATVNIDGTVSYTSIDTDDADAIVGNEVLDATASGSLVRDGSGTLVDPYTLDVADGGIDTDELSDNAVTSAKILDATITSTDLAVASVDASAINSNVAGVGLTKNPASGALDVDIASINGDGDITSSDLTVTGGTNAAFNNVTLEIAVGVVTSTEIKDETIASVDIADAAITNIKLADDAVQTENIADGTITTVDIANEAITTSKIKSGAANQILATNAVGDGVEWKDQTASEVNVTAISGITSTDVQGVLEELNTNSSDDQTASEVDYSNSTSGLTAENTQAAIDELAASNAADGDTDDENEIQTLTSTDGSITVTPDSEGKDYDFSIDLSGVNTDDQALSLSGNDLTLEDGGTVDLTPFLDNTDDQTITAFNLNDTTNELTLTLEDGGSEIVDFSTVLTAAGTDDQALSLSGNDLVLEDGGTVDLTPFLDNTDDQTITVFSLNDTTNELTLTLEDGGSEIVDFSTV
ncbi:hypothetical protein, partial [Galbibacter orientalis]|uniref:beta strand repeat-containing protein n=2 Tax=Galbibacter orientalis TaxID=453852 RepID=UPI0030801134